MSRRTALLAVLTTLVAGAAMATNPGPRYETRMVYDAKIQRIVLFGGITAADSGTAKAYDLGDTWEWNGQRWMQQFTPVAPTARSSHNMVYDQNRQRVLVFGGKNGSTYLNDTWKYEGGAWSQIVTPNSPPARVLAGGAYDAVRDRFIVYGGTGLQNDTAFAFRDTWEFDGTTWTQVGANGSGPDVAKPILVYDRKHNKTLMLAEDTSVVTKMYEYDSDAKTWKPLTPTLLPPCVNEGMVEYDTLRDVVVYTGGVCSDSASTDDTYEWSGDNWTKIDLNSNEGRTFGSGMAYDQAHQVMVLYGGFYSTAPRYQTYLYISGGWLGTSENQPAPRSLFVFASDPVNNTVWLFGGVSSGSAMHDLWKYQNGHFDVISGTDEPSSCASPYGAWDGDRKRLVVFCGVLGYTYEYDPVGNTWTGLAAKHIPPVRSFASLTYDARLKKTILFGGWDATNFRDDTWMWDGQDWTQVKKDPPPSRELASMWYDPILQKTVIFGGMGRLTSEDRLTRYNDMWQFDGAGWTEIKPTTLPGARYGSPVAVDPRNNHVFLFGGMRVTGDQTDPKATPVQSYVGDTWEWDGTNWKQVDANGAPPARENHGLAFDPNRNELVMFAGWAGYYLSDIWSLSGGNTWRPWTDTSLRRRAAGR